MTDTVVGIAAMLVLLGLAAGGGRNIVSPQRQDVGCISNLMGFAQALAACRAENNGFSPMWDDGNQVPPKVLFSWADLLADEGYVAVTQQRCPSDAHPDTAAALRGEQWGFNLMDSFGVGEPPRPGVRTSYASNAIVAYNWPEDRFADASRQIDILDGWWTWTGNLSAYWSLAAYVTGVQPSITTPNWQSAMTGFRHAQYRVNTLMLDGSVRAVEARIPRTTDELKWAVDTEYAFTWLPGEQNHRMDASSYQGTHQEWLGRYPRFYQMGWGVLPPAFPPHLMPSWRSEHNAWVTLPNPPDRH